MIQLTQNIGDSKTHSVPLRWNGRPFAPGTGWTLLFTVKANASQTDAQRLFQKTSTYGITVSGNTANVEVFRADTFRDSPAFEATAGEYVWDIQAYQIAAPNHTRTVASGTLTLNRDVTRLSGPTGPIFVVEDPQLLVVGPAGPQGPTGIPGPTGATGIQGDTGDQGPQGIQGVKGDTGLTGDTGPQGPQGIQGDTGAQGPPPWVFVGAYDNGADYAIGDAVTYSGGFYYRTGNPNNPGYPPAPGAITPSWTPVADKGDPGEGTSLTAGDGIDITGSVISLDMPDALSGFSGPINEVGTKATGTITFTGSPSPGQTITIASTTYYLAPTTSTGTPTDVSAPTGLSLAPMATQWATALAARINSWIGGGSDTNVTASSLNGVVTLTAKAAGPTGNSITLSELAENVSITSAMSGGSIVSYSSPVATHLGQLYYATSSKIWYRWDGNEWVKDDEYVGALSGLFAPLSPAKYAQGYPSMVLVGQDIIVSGITSPLAANGTYSLTEVTGALGKPTYQKAGSPSFTIASSFHGPSPSPSIWVLSENAISGLVGIVTTLFVSETNNTNTTPADATVWTRQNTSKDTTVASPVGSYRGQLDNQTSSGFWWTWNGTGWDADKVLTAGAGISITGSVISATGGTVDATITDGSTNAVSGNAVFDALALKAPLDSPVFTGSVTTSGDASIFTSGTYASIASYGDYAHIATYGDYAYIQSRATFKLHNGTHTTTLSHSPTANRAIAFPNTSGTVALINPSTGTQTFSGAQSFSSTTRPTSSASTATLAGAATSSLITKGDGDLRYGQTFVGIRTENYEATNNTPFELASVTLPIGMYQIDCNISAISAATGNGGYWFGLRADKDHTLSLLELFGAEGSSLNNNVIVGDGIEAGTVSTRITTNNSFLNYKRQLTGLLQVTADDTKVSIEFSLANATGGSCKTRKRAFIIARKIS